MSNSPNSESTDELSFEQAVEQLEQTVERLESGEVGLEECLAQYERGMRLVQRCQSVLARVQQRVKELTIDAAGQLRTDLNESADIP
jgi:exodeoxyribonuclease VII small subunit